MKRMSEKEMFEQLAPEWVIGFDDPGSVGQRMILRKLAEEERIMECGRTMDERLAEEEPDFWRQEEPPLKVKVPEPETEKRVWRNWAMREVTVGNGASAVKRLERRVLPGRWWISVFQHKTVRVNGEEYASVYEAYRKLSGHKWLDKEGKAREILSLVIITSVVSHKTHHLVQELFSRLVVPADGIDGSKAVTAIYRRIAKLSGSELIIAKLKLEDKLNFAEKVA